MPSSATRLMSRRAVLTGLGATAAAVTLSGCPASTGRHAAQGTAAQGTAAQRTAAPDIHPDRRVTFRLTAGRATSVSVTGSWATPAGPQPLIRDSGGGWSLTLGPLPPNFYTYNFIVDGDPAKDPANPSPVHSAATLSTFLVTGPGAEFLTPGPGPHGTVSAFSYHSGVIGADRDATVWLPPGYDQGRGYPTLYLLHGGGGDHLDWVQQGCANVILDNLHAAGRLAPMVVVMPNGNIGNAMGLPLDDTFAGELLDSLVPAIQRTYHVNGTSAGRALAGLSLGGLHTWNVLLSRPGELGAIGDFSAGYAPLAITALTTQFPQLLRDAASKARTTLHRIYLGNRTDVVYADNVHTRAMFDAHGIRYTFQQYDGSGHTWETWRHHLLDFAPRLFR